MSEDSDAEAAISHADEWYSRRLGKRYTPHVVRFVCSLMKLGARKLPLHELAHLKADFAKTFPIKTGYFSAHYSRFGGYAQNSWAGGREKDTRELETMAPAFEVRKKTHDLASRLEDAAGDNPVSSLDDLAVEKEFAGTFGNLADFTAFCLGYLRTRMLNSHARVVWKIDGEQYEIRRRNFNRVWHAVNYFNVCVFGDLVWPVTSSSSTLMPRQYPSQDGCAPGGTSLPPLQNDPSGGH